MVAKSGIEPVNGVFELCSKSSLLGIVVNICPPHPRVAVGTRVSTRLNLFGLCDGGH